MEKRKEPVPLFNKLDKVKFNELPHVILSVHTYCMCCNRFLDEARYSIVSNTGEVFHKVADSDLTFLEE
jgi:hypothetical protein